MRVKCVKNDPKYASGVYPYLGSSSGNNGSTYMLTIGKEYTVYALSSIGAQTMYLLLDDSNYPADELIKRWGEPDLSWYDAKLFEVTDSTIDPEWLKVQGTVFTQEGETSSFPELVNNFKNFYDQLIDGNEDQVKIFLKYVQKYEQ